MNPLNVMFKMFSLFPHQNSISNTDKNAYWNDFLFLLEINLGDLVYVAKKGGHGVGISAHTSIVMDVDLLLHRVGCPSV